MKKPSGRRARDTGAYNALSAMERKPAGGNPADLGKRIMASRNINMRK